MKHTLNIIFCFGLSLYMNAQNNCDHNIVTNWIGPVNNALPYTFSSPTIPDATFLNAFNWITTNPIQLSNMQYNQLMVSLKNPQQAQYYSYIYNGEDLSPKNGWELLLFNIGTYPNLVSNPTGEIPDVPYIVLYNRYTGIVRVFANYGNGYLPSGISFDAVKVILTFDGIAVNGLLRLAEGKDQTLDQNTDITQIVSLAKHPNAPGKWFSSDFQITYDPCICYFPSDMRINFEFITSESIELHGREISMEQDLINGTALETKDYLSNFDYTGNTADGGMIMYKAMSALVDDYESQLLKYKDDLALANEYNEKVERNLAVIKMFKHTVIQGGNGIIAEIGNMPWFNQVITHANDLIGDTVLTKKQIIDEAKKGFAKRLDQLITKNFQKMPTPSSPNTPMATFTEMHFQGDLSNNTPIAGPNFYTPGTYGSLGTASPTISSALKYPIYNNALGVFALINKPKIKISKTVPIFGQENSISQSTITSNTGSYLVKLYRYQTWVKNYQIQLAEDLKFALNSSLDIKNYKIQASFNIKAIPKNMGKPTSAIINSYHEPFSNVNVTSTNTDLMLPLPIGSNDREEGYYQNPIFEQTHYDIEYEKENSSKIYNDTVLIETPYVPLDAFFPMVTGVGIRNDVMNYYENFFWDYQIDTYDHTQDSYGNYIWNLNDPDLIKPTSASSISHGFEFEFKIELKLIVDVEFNTIRTDGSPNSITQIHTFDIAPEDITWLINDIIPNLATTTDNVGQYPQNINFSTTDFHGQTVQGCELVGTEYTCQAWNNITISGNLSTSNGFKAYIKAGNEINVVDESVISPETVLMINPILDYSHPMPMADGIYVQQFCQGTLGGNAPNYHANSSGKNPQDVLIAEQLNEQKDDESFMFDFNLYPNPTELFTTVKLTSSEPVNIQLFDITGKEIQFELVRLDSNLYKLDMPNCEKGIYLVKVTSYAGTQTKQLILQ